MTQPNERDVVFKAAERLEFATREAVKEIEGFRVEFVAAVGQLNAADAANRRAIRYVALFGALLLVVATAVGVVWYRTDLAQEKADAVQNVQRNNCEVGNSTRKAQRELWATVAELSARDRTQTPADRKRTTEFLDYVNTTFADRDCNALLPR